MQSIILSKTSRNMCSTSNLSCSFGGIDDDDDDDSDDDDSADDDVTIGWQGALCSLNNASADFKSILLQC